MRQRVGVDPSRLLLFSGIALGGLIFDLVTKAMIFAWIGPHSLHPRVVPLIPRVLELQTSQNTGALWGLGAGLPGSSLIFARFVAAPLAGIGIFIPGAVERFQKNLLCVRR